MTPTPHPDRPSGHAPDDAAPPGPVPQGELPGDGEPMWGLLAKVLMVLAPFLIFASLLAIERALRN